MRTTYCKTIAAFLLALALIASAQDDSKPKKAKPSAAPTDAGTNTATEDISGMYSFLKDGEFVQISLDQNSVSGYISRLGDMESDRGEVLDQFFTKAAIRGHEISFTTKAVHGIWFEFKGRFERGPAKSKAEDAFYILRGSLSEFGGDPSDKNAARTREVEFKWLAQPDEGPNLTKH